MTKSTDNDLGSFQGFLETLLENGYEDIFFKELTSESRQLIMRHDIDFDTGFALKTAKIETSLGIKATYFFLLRCNFYNIYSPGDFENVLQIRELGHEITLHFDPMIYEDFSTGLNEELVVFEQLFGIKPDIISFHRPNKFFQNFDKPILGIEHTYQSKFFHDIKYLSDSTGRWRFGHPFDTPEFRAQKTLHILMHPIWWMVNGASNTEKLRTYFSNRVEALITEFYNHSIPFRAIHESLRKDRTFWL